MHSFTIDDDLLNKLSPATRKELLAVMAQDLASIRAKYADLDWDPEGTMSYPLTVEEARHLINGMPEPARNALRVFTEHCEGDRGEATIEQLLSATGHSKAENVTKQLAWILLRVRTVTGDQNAWLLNWHAKDWEMDRAQSHYIKGKYFISGHAMTSLLDAFALEDAAA
ncbi:MAG: hypothetical protein ACR2RL_19650 [Gammaproteobacteria bacterium]